MMKQLYLVPTNNAIQWGERIYFYNCHKKGGDYKWFANNLEKAKGNPAYKNITPQWLFGNRWNP